MNDILIFIAGAFAGVFVGVIITGVAIFLSALICQSEETLNKNYWPEDDKKESISSAPNREEFEKSAGKIKDNEQVFYFPNVK